MLLLSEGCNLGKIVVIRLWFGDIVFQSFYMVVTNVQLLCYLDVHGQGKLRSQCLLNMVSKHSFRIYNWYTTLQLLSFTVVAAITYRRHQWMSQNQPQGPVLMEMEHFEIITYTFTVIHLKSNSLLGLCKVSHLL